MRRASAGANLPSRSGFFIWLFGGIEYISQTQKRLYTHNVVKEAVPLGVGAYVINTSSDDRPA